MRIRLLLFGLLVLTFGCLLGSVGLFELYHAQRIYPGVWIWDVDIGGLTPEEAGERLRARLSADQQRLTLVGPGQTWSVRPTDLGARVDIDATLTPAYQVGRRGSWLSNLGSHLRLLRFGQRLSPVIIYDEAQARRYLEALAAEIDEPVADAGLALEGTTPILSAARSGRRLDVDVTLNWLSPAVMRLRPVEVPLAVQEIQPSVMDAEQAHAEAVALLAGSLTLTLAEPQEGDPGPWTIPVERLAGMLVVREEAGLLHATLDRSALAGYLQTISPTLAVEPQDARFHFNEYTDQLIVVSASQAGRALDIEASVTRVLEQLSAEQRHIALVLRSTSPRYPDTATAEEIGIVERVATGESYFIGSPSGRDHNIRVAAAKFDGLIIPPGETFSFNEHLGEVTAEAGYDESYVTAGDELAIEVGGGICQVSTTAFRAAFWGGYPITERWYHNHRIGYYELGGAGVGMDATVYAPHVDLKFVNDRPTPLLIETQIYDADHRLVFRFYSTDDGRRVEADDVVISDEQEPPPPLYRFDESLPEGAVERWQSAVGGLTATIERRVYDAADTLILQDAFVSRHVPRRAIYDYGPGYVPPDDGDVEE